MNQLRYMAAAWPLLLLMGAIAVAGITVLLRRRGPRRQRVSTAACWGWLCATLFFVLYPRPAAPDGRLTLELIGFGGHSGPLNLVANVLLFLPLGALPVLGRLRWRYAAIPIALVFSLLIEVVQYVGDFGRTADVNDVLANTVGAAVGTLLAGLGLHAVGAGVDRRASGVVAPDGVVVQQSHAPHAVPGPAVGGQEHRAAGRAATGQELVAGPLVDEDGRGGAGRAHLPSVVAPTEADGSDTRD